MEIVREVKVNDEGLLLGNVIFNGENNEKLISLILIRHAGNYYGDHYSITATFSYSKDYEIAKKKSIEVLGSNASKNIGFLYTNIEDYLDANLPMGEENFLAFDFSSPNNPNENLEEFKKRMFLFFNVIATSSELDKTTYEKVIGYFGLQEQKKQTIVKAACRGFALTLFNNADIGNILGKYVPPQAAYSMALINKNCTNEVRKLSK